MNPNSPPDWGNALNAKDRLTPTLKPKLEPKVDMEVTKAVGFKVFAHDPRLIKKIVEWKANKPQGSTKPDHFLYDANKVAELKKVLSQP